MADKKWSVFPSAASYAVADHIVGLVGGVNSRIARDVFLAMNSGEYILMGNGNLTVYFDDTGVLQITNSAGAQIDIDPAGNINIIAAPGATFSNGSGTGSITIDGTGHATLTDGSGVSSDVSYVAGHPGSWAGAAPNNFATAIDRLAAAVQGLLGHPIP